MRQQDSDRPLIGIAEECDRADAEAAREAQAKRSIIRQRILQAQAAVEALGIRRGSTPWRLVGLIAKIAGWESLKITRRELCEDPDLDCKEASVKAALGKLELCGIIERSTIYAQTCTGKIESVGIDVTLNRRRIAELYDGLPESGSIVRRRIQAPPVGCVHDSMQPATKGVTKGVMNPVTNPVMNPVTKGVTKGVTNPAKNANHSLCLSLIPISYIPSSPSPEEKTATAAILEVGLQEEDPELIAELESAGCECPKMAVQEATRHRVKRSELIDACYVVRHTQGLSGGALLFWIRNGGWPATKVKSAEQLRADRRRRADEIRSCVRRDAREATRPPPAQPIPEWRILAVSARRLGEAKLEEFITGDEHQASQRMAVGVP
jgi:hypothetical protein